MVVGGVYHHNRQRPPCSAVLEIVHAAKALLPVTLGLCCFKAARRVKCDSRWDPGLASLQEQKAADRHAAAAAAAATTIELWCVRKALLRCGGHMCAYIVCSTECSCDLVFAPGQLQTG